jgi:tetratricopeptide (TPR) repeat protein
VAAVASPGAELLDSDPASVALQEALLHGDIEAADRAASLLRAELRSTSVNDTERAMALAMLGTALMILCAGGDDLALDEAIEALREAVDVLPDDDPDRASVCRTLAGALGRRVLGHYRAEDAAEVIPLLREAAALDEQSEERIAALTMLGRVLLARAGRMLVAESAVDDSARNRDEDEEEALAALREALRARQHGAAVDADAPLSIGTLVGRVETGQIAAPLARGLLGRSVRRDDPELLDEAIDVLRAVTRAGAESAYYHATLAEALQRRFDYGHDLGDLTEAIGAWETALRCTPLDDPGRPARLESAGRALINRFTMGGRADGVDRAVTLLREAVAGSAADDPDRQSRLLTLSTALGMRFHREGALTDLDEAIQHVRAAAESMTEPAGDTSDSVETLAIWGMWLRARFRRTRRIQDLDAAVDVARRAVAAAAYTPSRPLALNLLGGVLTTRFEHRQSRNDLNEQDRNDLDEAIDALTEMAEVLPAEPARLRIRTRGILALSQRLRYELDGAPSDIHEAIDALRAKLSIEGNEIEGNEDAQRPYTLGALGDAFRSLFQRTRDQTALDQALSYYREAARMRTAPASIRLQLAKSWAELAGSVGDWAEATAGSEHAVALLPLVAARGLSRADHERLLHDNAGTATSGAAFAALAGQPKRAVEILEGGRGVLLTQTLDMRTDMTELRARDPELARMLDEVAVALETVGVGVAEVSVLASGSPASMRREERRALAQQWDRLVEQVRRIDGFADFLRPPSVSGLQAAAVEGPIVMINVSRRRSDAFVLRPDGVQTVPLPDLEPDGLGAHMLSFLTAVLDPDNPDARHVMQKTLGWLWDAVAGPVLDVVTPDPRPADPSALPRLWWIPTGLLSLLPLHAAGQPGTGGVMDRVVSSYAPTVGTLARVRSRSRTTRRPRVTVVALPEHHLKEAFREVRYVTERFPGVRTLKDSDATRANVMSALQDSQIVHFTCHGYANFTRPSGGFLRLHDGNLTLLDLARLRLPDAELAFLSACLTATGGDVLPDEAVHLATAFQLAGYRHVIGTLWPIQDAPGADVADRLYRHLGASLGTGVEAADETDVARALHSAVRELRDAHPDHPDIWASHIHLGP